MDYGQDTHSANEIKAALKGRELDVLRHLGVAWPQGGKPHIHCPFPGHADKDASWRWDAGQGRFFCTCEPGGGDILDVARHTLGRTLPEAIAHLSSAFLGERPDFSCKEKSPQAPIPTPQTLPDEASARHRRERALVQWDAAGAIEGPAVAYLSGARGITPPSCGWPLSIGYANALYHKAPATKAVSHHPAILMAMSKAPGGEIEAIGRVWLAEDGSAKADVSPNKAALASIHGLACWFGTPSPRLVIVEGLEDALSVLSAGERFVCAAFTGSNVANVTPPPGVTELVFLGDRAEDGEGLDETGAAALARGRPRWELAGIVVCVAVPNAPHKDANDVLRAHGPDALRGLIDAPNENDAIEREDCADRRELGAELPPDEAETFDVENDADAEIRPAADSQAEGEASSDRLATLTSAVAELARLAPAEFTLIKGERAKALGVSKADLTRLVNAGRKEAAKKERVHRVAGGLDWPEVNDKGEPAKRSQENIRFFFDHARIDLSFDQMTSAVRVVRGGEPSDLTDPVAKAMWLEADELGLHADEGYFMAVLENTARQNSFHPLRDYLDGLEWDGNPRLDTWLTDYMGAEDTELHRAFGRKHLIGAVRRIQRPGTKYDTILIFQGIQGQGKSSFIRALSPEDEYFSDAMKIGADIQEIMEVCSGKWLIEIPELDGMGRKDAAAVKAMLSRQTDEARMAYGRYKTRIPRQFVLFGSVNDSHFLQDTTGNRRFWPVTVKPMEVAEAIVARLIENRDQLWAEAAHYESQGESVVLPRELWEAAAEAQQARMVIDPWAEKLDVYLTNRGSGFVETSEIYSVLGVSGDKENVMNHKRVHGIMTGFGYRHSRPTADSGKRVTGYTNCD